MLLHMHLFTHKHVQIFQLMSKNYKVSQIYLSHLLLHISSLCGPKLNNQTRVSSTAQGTTHYVCSVLLSGFQVTLTSSVNKGQKNHLCGLNNTAVYTPFGDKSGYVDWVYLYPNPTHSMARPLCLLDLLKNLPLK